MIKWGVIGCGGIADRRTIPGIVLAENAELVAVMDTNRQLADTVKEKYNAKYVFYDVDDILALDEIDAVYIATPVFCHKEQAIKAAKAKKHILLEKPMGKTVAEAEEIKAVCEAEGVKLGVGLMMRFHSIHQKMKQLIAEGKIGEIVSMRAQFSCWYPDIEGAWRQDKTKSGGGALMDLAVHCIDALIGISGLKPTLVTGLAMTQTFNYTADDSGAILMKMNNGSFAIVDSNFNVPDEAAVSKLEIYGTRGSFVAYGSLAQLEEGYTVDAYFADGAGGYDAMQNRDGAKAVKLTAETENMYQKEIEGFSNAIINNTAPPIGADDGILAQKVVECTYQSSDTKKHISL